VGVALVQGTLGGFAFWTLGIAGALLWGAVMALLSLLPAVGAALVWGPVAIYLASTGSLLPALGLTLWGVLVIGLVDNVLRPILVGRDSDTVVFSSEVCGINEVLPDRDWETDIYPNEREIVAVDNNLEVQRWKQ
jgi:predicted PurR-regulated permease PerM